MYIQITPTQEHLSDKVFVPKICELETRNQNGKTQ